MHVARRMEVQQALTDEVDHLQTHHMDEQTNFMIIQVPEIYACCSLEDSSSTTIGEVAERRVTRVAQTTQSQLCCPAIS